MRELNGVGRKRKRKIKEKKKACWVCFSFLCCVLNYNYFIVTTFCYIFFFNNFLKVGTAQDCLFQSLISTFL